MVPVDFDWDDRKSRQLKRKRGFSFEEVVRIFEGVTVEGVKRDNPRQWFAIGLLQDRLLTVIYEERGNEEGCYNWLVTYWYSTRAERKFYEQNT
jgi:uncharacterized DUF497 family protein